MSRLQPQVHLSRFSIAWIAARLSRAVTGSSGRPARCGSPSLPEGPAPGSVSWAVGRKGGTAVSKPVPTTPRNTRRETGLVSYRLTAIPPYRPSPTSFTTYPACARLTAGAPPPGHITTSPPSATTIPPYHTHHTSGLIVKR